MAERTVGTRSHPVNIGTNQPTPKRKEMVGEVSSSTCSVMSDSVLPYAL